jgi:hypothetical protein
VIGHQNPLHGRASRSSPRLGKGLQKESSPKRSPLVRAPRKWPTRLGGCADAQGRSNRCGFECPTDSPAKAVVVKQPSFLDLGQCLEPLNPGLITHLPLPSLFRASGGSCLPFLLGCKCVLNKSRIYQVGFARLLYPISTRLGGNVDVVRTKPVQATDLTPSTLISGMRLLFFRGASDD